MLTIAPPEAYSSSPTWRRRLRRLRAALCAQARRRRSRRRRFHRAGPRGRGGRRARRRLPRRQPDARAVPERPRAREPLSSLRPAFSGSAADRCARRERPARRCGVARSARFARRAYRLGGGAATRSITPPSGSSSSRRCERASPPSSALARRARTRKSSPTTRASSKQSGEALKQFAVFQAISSERHGEDWRNWPDALRIAEPAALAAKASELADDVDFALFCAIPRRPATRRGGRASARGRARNRALSRSRGRLGARRRGELVARRRTRHRGQRRRAARSVSPRTGQIWHLPAPDPIAGARDGWRGLAALYGANMRHAGLLRIDHAMGLTRLFVIPAGARPAEGAYLAYPVDDLIGQIALESQRRQCMIIGEDLGTVPEGFREKLTRANIAGHARALVRAQRPRFPRSRRLSRRFRSPAPRRTICRRWPAGGRAPISPSA